ncbi:MULTISPECIES: restriction endonuclease subunit S [unclassified Lysinibacillus]|uniref:restriction endonuclease subunit S n=1 Tax=unclassified Lysinibacillus TaxID=2636778 RepID=UPI00380816D1
MMSKKRKSQTLEELLEEAIISEDEVPYDIPENWAWVKLGEVVKINPPKPKLNYDDNLYCSFLPMNMVNAEKGSISELKEKSFHKVKKGYTYFEEGDILFAKITPCMENGNTVIAEGLLSGFGFGSTEFYVLKPSKGILGKYLYYLVRSKSFRYEAKQVMSGAVGQQRVPKSFLEKYPFALPPLNEQEKIVSRLDELYSKIEKAQRLIEEARQSSELRRAGIIQKAFSGELTKKWRLENKNSHVRHIVKRLKELYPKKTFEIIEGAYNIPDSWRYIKLGDILEVNPKKEKIVNVKDEDKVSFVPMSAVSDLTGTIEGMEYKEYGMVKKGYTYFKGRDILFAKITPCMENGKITIASNLINGFGFGSTEFHVLRTPECVNERYVYYLLRSNKFRGEAQAQMTGSVGQQRVPKSFLENYSFPLPPKEEQDVIVSILDNIRENEDVNEKILNMNDDIEILKQSIFSKGFKGKLGTCDLTDEPAIELLRSVLQEK